MFSHRLDDDNELRILELRHAPEFLAFVDENREYLGRWLQWGTDITTLEHAQAFLQRGVTRFAEDGLPWTGIWHRGEMAGGLLFFPINHGIASTDVGYWLGEKFAGAGLMTRSLTVALDHAFGVIGVNRIGLEAEVDNVRSRAVAERLGFQLEGIRRQVWKIRGELIDNAAYSLLASEWRELSAQRRGEEGAG
jgi:ribosomal-protein-serine acetyltransferase